MASVTYGKCIMANVIMAKIFMAKILWQMKLSLINLDPGSRNIIMYCKYVLYCKWCVPENSVCTVLYCKLCVPEQSVYTVLYCAAL